LLNLQAEFYRRMPGILDRLGDKAETFDTYRPQSLAGESLTVLPIITDYELLEVRTLVVTGPAGGQSSIQASGSLTSPAAFANIATATVPPGEYNLYVIFNLAGTPAQGTDNSNIRLVGAGLTASPITLANEIAAGDQNFGPFQAVATNLAGTAYSLQVAGNAGTSGAVYAGTIIAVPVNGVPFTLQLGSRAWQLQLPPTGILTERFNPGLKLKQSDVKQLISGIAGNWAVELTGYRDDQRF
jgi:hypothetical protein